MVHCISILTPSSLGERVGEKGEIQLQRTSGHVENHANSINGMIFNFKTCPRRTDAGVHVSPSTIQVLHVEDLWLGMREQDAEVATPVTGLPVCDQFLL